jgi:hypothetical protein
MNNFGLPISGDREKEKHFDRPCRDGIAFFSFSRHFVPGYFHRVPPGRAQKNSTLDPKKPNRQPPTANRQPPTANRQPPTANRQPPTANRQPLTANR